MNTKNDIILIRITKIEIYKKGGNYTDGKW